MKHLILVEGDINLLSNNEILVSQEDEYPVLRRRLESGEIETYLVIPLKEFKNAANTGEKVEEG